MNKTLKVILAIGMAFSINGCINLDKDGQYMGSDFEKVHIQDLSNGYYFSSYADYNGVNDILRLYFCKKNKFIIRQSGANGKRYEGVYSVNLDQDTISLITDGLGRNGKKLRDTLKVKDGYIRQKHRLRDISLEGGKNKDKIHLYMEDITHIKSSDCPKNYEL